MNYTIYFKKILHQYLKPLSSLTECILLDYPNHFNIGDHLIWLGEIFYLINTLGVKINYTAHLEDFSDSEVVKYGTQCPILLHGGGNLGDLWLKHQNFREYIISKYPKNPISILPQTIYFQDHSNLIKTANIFNQHSNLTIFVRDNYSYDVAIKYFDQCRVFKSPDMAFQLIETPNLKTNFTEKKSLLYLCREDKEINSNLSLNFTSLSNFICEDWGKIYDENFTSFNQWSLNKKTWTYFNLNFYQLRRLPQSDLHLQSWMYLYKGVSQFKQHRLIITNRLHGHILCILMGIPHIFIPNSYYKNKAFYESWTHSIPFCRFVENRNDIEDKIKELLWLCS